MKKLIPAALFGFVLFVAAGWSISWFLQARALENNLRALINAADPSLGTFVTEDIQTSGFPTHIIVTVKNPSITLNLKNVLTQLYKRTSAAAGNSAGVLAAPEYPDAAYEYKLTGDMTVSLNALSDHLQITSNGSDSQRLSNNESSFALQTDHDGPTHCNVRLVRSLSSAFNRIWNMERFFTAETLANEVQSFECRISGGIATDSVSNQMLLSIAPSDFAFKRQPASADRTNISLTFNIKDSEFMPAGDEMYAKAIKMLMPKEETWTPPTPSLYGKQTIALDMALDAPKDSTQMSTQPFSIQIKNLSYDNAAGKTHFDLHIASNPQGENQQMQLQSNLVMDTTPRQTEIAKSLLPQIVSDITKDPNLAPLLSSKDSIALEIALFDALPNITKLGTITQKIDLNFSGNHSKKTGTADIKALELSTRDYGVLANGNVAMNEGQMTPTANANISCKNCLPMLDTLAAYLARFDAALASVGLDKALQLSLPPAQVQGVKSLLAAVGTPATSTADLTFAIKNDAGGLSINGKTAQELALLVQQHLAPALQQPAP